MSWRKIDKAGTRLAATHSIYLTRALNETIDPAQVAEAFLQTFPHGGTLSPDEARSWAKTHVVLDNRPLIPVLNAMHAEGYKLGLDASYYAYGTQVMKKDAVQDAINAALSIDWSTWKPGNAKSALLLEPPSGLATLLDRTKATIQGIQGTTLERLGTVLYGALKAGTPSAAIAGDVASVISEAVTEGTRAVLRDPARALMIARTEIARAQSVASNDNYKDLGVERVTWFALEPCAICAINADVIVPQGSEFPSGDTEPPAHPNCRCVLAPVIAGFEQIVQGPALPTNDEMVASINARAKEAERMFLENARQSPALQVAIDAVERATLAEPAISAAIQDVAASVGADLAGFDFRLKTVDSLLGKIFRDAAEKNISYAAASKKIVDNNRYTMLATPANYANMVRNAIAQLESMGYEVYELKNSWLLGREYKGLNGKVRAPDGTEFELQFHTPQSWNVKDANHADYQAVRSLPPGPSALADFLNERMAGRVAEITIPPDAETLVL